MKADRGIQGNVSQTRGPAPLKKRLTTAPGRAAKAPSQGPYKETIHREAFRKMEVMGSSFWAYTKVLDVNKLGRVRVVGCYHNVNLEGEPVFLTTSRLYREEKRIVECYSLRFRIDRFYKDA